jgi:hypothetical protein
MSVLPEPAKASPLYTKHLSLLDVELTNVNGFKAYSVKELEARQKDIAAQREQRTTKIYELGLM